MSCIHCYTARFHILSELSKSEKLRLARELASIGIEHVSLSGGEPLIHEDLTELIKVLKEEGIEISIVTNGSVVDSDRIELLARYGVSVYVSVDGPKAIHDRIRYVGSFDRAMSFLTKLRELGLEFGTVMAVSTVNYMYSGEYVEIVMKFEPYEVALIPVMPVGRARITGTYVSYLEYLYAVRQALEKAQNYGVYLHLWCSPFIKTVIPSPKVVAYGCRTLDVIDIDPAGRLMLCDTVDIVVASIRREGSLRKAIEKYVTSDIVKRVIYPQLSKPCSECSLRTWCKGGCFSRAYTLFGDLNAGDPLCPLVAKYQRMQSGSGKP